MPHEKDLILGIRNVKVIEKQSYQAGVTWIVCRLKPTKQCPHCGCKSISSKGLVWRKFKHLKMSGMIICLRVRHRKVYCHGCKKYSREQIDQVKPRMRSSEHYRREVFELHQGGLTQIHLARSHKISCATVEKWTWDFIGYRLKETKTRMCPKILGIDEHFFTRRQGYATTLVDLQKHHVFDVQLGRSEKSLQSYLNHLKGKDRAKVVVMDLSETYRSIARKHFPNAMIVADRFHVIRMIQHHFQKTWMAIDPEGRRNRGLLTLLRRNRSKLNSQQLGHLDRYFEKFPVLGEIDQVIQRLLEILRLKGLGRGTVKSLLPELSWIVNQLKTCGIRTLEVLGHTISDWFVEICRMLRFTKTNSITEGFHTKMEMLSRRAYGFRKFENYRLRVLALCGWSGLFNRIDL